MVGFCVAPAALGRLYVHGTMRLKMDEELGGVVVIGTWTVVLHERTAEGGRLHTEPALETSFVASLLRIRLRPE
jgi:hypothetical protein